MARGRHPKPTELKRLAGNPGKRKLNEQEPQPEVVLPPAPTNLTEVGRAKWNEVAEKLYAQGILTELDVDLLYLYCKNYEAYQAAESAATISGPVIRSTNGNPFQNPYLSIANQAQERMIRIMSMMGMSPADRSKVKANPRPKPESLAEKFFNAPVAQAATVTAPRKAHRRRKAEQPAEQPAAAAGQEAG